MGYQSERLSASLALIFYTVMGSMPLFMFSIRILYVRKLSFWFQLPQLIINQGIRLMIILRSLIAFLVKFPIFMGHLWLPKAHVEAPVVGSIILASILLKLGGYGLIRLSVLLRFNSTLRYIFSIAVTGSSFIGLTCLTQIDIKVIIAYSSVAHIGITIGGLIYFTQMGLAGALILIIAHGLSSSAIFFGGNVLYLRRFSRRVILRKGFLSSTPLISFM